MIIYNVTINVEDSIHDEFMKWMREVHVKDVVNTGCFSSGTIYKVLVDEAVGTSYAFQYRAPNMHAVDRYMSEFAPKLRKEVTDKFGDKFTAFRTLLQEV
jgi:hypothetical protein